MIIYLYVALGGALGTLARFGLTQFVAGRLPMSLPVDVTLGTMFINITGSFVIGLFAGLTGPGGRWHVESAFRTFFLVGICGGYTTFSSFSLQTLDLARLGAWPWVLLNVLGSVAGCLLAVWAGSAAAALVNARS